MISFGYDFTLLTFKNLNKVGNDNRFDRGGSSADLSFRDAELPHKKMLPKGRKIRIVASKQNVTEVKGQRT